MQPERVMVLWVPELDEALFGTRGGRDRGRRGEIEDPALIEQRRRHWDRLVRSVEELVPGIEPLRPGWCAMRARGPARYYGAEHVAAAALITRAAEPDATGSYPALTARVGVANGRFTAEQAARASDGELGIHSPSPGVRIVPDDATARFLAPLPIDRAADEELAGVLLSLGIRTLGAFAALPESAVRERFGPAGIAAHRRARGQAAAHAPEIRPREPEKELWKSCAFEPPLEGADQLAFACSAAAETLITGLVEQGLVCTELQVGLIDDIGERHERRWAHPTRFTAADVVNRVRWQADAIPHDTERGGAGIVEVRLVPLRTARAAEHEPGLWSTAPDERVHHHLSRVQSLLGHEGVATGELTGGRLSADRQRLVAWGTEPLSRRSSMSRPRERTQARARTGPWPGSLTGAAPSSVFATPKPAMLLDREGGAVGIDLDRLLSAEPARLDIAGLSLHAPVRGWSAPWPLRERWWAEKAVQCYRLQLLLDDGDAWLLRYETKLGWLAEARYA